MADKKSAPVLDTIEALLGGLEAAVLKPIAVPVPELGGTVYVIPLTTDEWLDPEAGGKLPEGATATHRRGWSVARWVCDGEGKRIVKPDNLPVLERFAALPYQAAHRILSTAGVVGGDAEKNV